MCSIFPSVGSCSAGHLLTFFQLAAFVMVIFVFSVCQSLESNPGVVCNCDQTNVQGVDKMLQYIYEN